MFKFNFGGDDGDAGAAPGGAAGGVDVEAATPCLPAREEKLEGLVEDIDEMAEEALFEPVHMLGGNLVMKRCNPPDSSTLGALADVVGQSDLTPGVYEGGFKVWEGSVDLVEYLAKNSPSIPLGGRRVIELGCGHALPGLYALKQGASVDLQDYNKEVLDAITGPNAAVNCKGVTVQPRYFSGDWGSLPQCAGAACYDMVLTAETIYSEESVHRLIQCIDELLKPSGVAYVAAKSYYFGVGGSTRRFADLVAQKMPKRTLKRAELIQDGQSNVREILFLSAEMGA